MKLSLIAALDENRVIGNKGGIPWHIPEDFKHFKETTKGFPVIMGRKTFESIGRPLPKRLNIILTRNKEFVALEGCVVCDSLEKGIEIAKQQQPEPEKAFVIGGAGVYEQALSFADEMILSHVPGTHEGDTFFPQWSDEWVTHEEKDFGKFVVKIYHKNQFFLNNTNSH